MIALSMAAGVVWLVLSLLLVRRAFRAEHTDLGAGLFVVLVLVPAALWVAGAVRAVADLWGRR